MKTCHFRPSSLSDKFLLAIIGLWATLIIIAMLPYPAFAQGPIEVLEEFPISYVDGHGFQAISGDIVVFDSNGDIYGYDLSTYTGFRITHHGGSQLPDISGDTIVWSDHRNGNWDIYGHDLSEAREFRITHNAADQMWPVIDGHTVVWVDWRNGGEPPFGYDLYGYDLASGTEFRITGNSAPTTCPAISGDVVVWSDRRYGGWEIRSYSLISHTETQITQSWASSPYCPAISNHVIVFGQDSFVYGTDLSGNLLFEAPTLLYPFYGRPAIDGNLVVWQERSFVGVCLYLCPSTIVGSEITSGHKFLVPLGLHEAWHPAISGNVVVWRDHNTAFEPPAQSPSRVYASKLLKTVQLSVSPRFVDPGDVLTYTMALAEVAATGSHRSITDSLSSLVTLDPPSLSATSGSYGYDIATHVITWTGDVSSYAPVTITYNATVNLDASLGQHITNTAVISDQTSVFTRTVSSWVARRTYLPVIMRSVSPPD
jgi:beta propeller repeat protein